jgi:hypothetical protein
MEFHYDGGGLGKPGDIVLFVHGDKIGAGRVDATVAMVFSADESCDVAMAGNNDIPGDQPRTELGTSLGPHGLRARAQRAQACTSITPANHPSTCRNGYTHVLGVKRVGPTGVVDDAG